jgi:hypothetical protein
VDKTQYVLDIAVLIDEEHPSSSFIPFHFEWEDEEGYAWYDPAISINKAQLEELAALFSLPVENVREQVLAHERGHALAFAKGEDHTDETLAWDYALEFCREIDPRLREYCLSTYLPVSA